MQLESENSAQLTTYVDVHYVGTNLHLQTVHILVCEAVNYIFLSYALIVINVYVGLIKRHSDTVLGSLQRAQLLYSVSSYSDLIVSSVTMSQFQTQKVFQQTARHLRLVGSDTIRHALRDLSSLAHTKAVKRGLSMTWKIVRPCSGRRLR